MPCIASRCPRSTYVRLGQFTDANYYLFQQLACTTSTGFALLNLDGTLEYLAEPMSDEQVSITRFNDGACDAKGRFFAGTASKESVLSPEGGTGKLYRYDPLDHTCTVIDEGPFTVSLFDTSYLCQEIYLPSRSGLERHGMES